MSGKLTALKNKAVELKDDVIRYWDKPALGNYIPFKEVTAYAGGGIGAYFIFTMGQAVLLSTNNTLISSSIGMSPGDMYILYILSVVANIPLTGIRANIIDNTRSKSGKYRPYILRMGLPTAIICTMFVWFPYGKLVNVFGTGMIFGREAHYIAKCAIVLLFNFLLQFFYNFFYDSYENLIHVLSPNSQERTFVTSFKSIVYSFAPTLTNFITPVIAENIFHTNMTDIRVYRLLFPIIGTVGMLLCIVVYKHTSEKIVQARTHIVSIKFTDALRAVAKNKYFWIISLAGWLGFLESAYVNILYWLYNYGGVCNGDQYAIITFIYGDASLWGMLLAPFCIKKWGKKSVLVFTNLFNILFISVMYPVVDSIWLVLACLYLNAFMGSFAHVLNPAIQADIRDYQQYVSGERIDGMFSAIGTIGSVVTLVTSAVLPWLYNRGGINIETAKRVTSDPAVLSRVLGNGKTIGSILAEQASNGQSINEYSALYDTDILYSLLRILVIVSVIGAAMNVLPYFWYDFKEKKQKAIVRVLKIRALFEDYDNNALKDSDLVEAIDLINNAQDMVKENYKPVKKSMYSSGTRKENKKQYIEARKFNEEIDISKFVTDELNKYDSPLMQREVADYSLIYSAGLDGLLSSDYREVKSKLKNAKAMRGNSEEDKAYRSFCIGLAREQKTSCRIIKKYYSNGVRQFVQPDIAELERLFDREDEIDELLLNEYSKLSDKASPLSKREKADCNGRIENLKRQKREAAKEEKRLRDEQSFFKRAAKPYIDAERMLNQKKNYGRFEEIAALYPDAKDRVSAAKALAEEEEAKKREMKDAQRERLKAEKAARKNK